MKVLLKLITENNRLPIDYRRVFLSVLKGCIESIADGKYFDKYFASAERRNFTFAVKLTKPKFEKDEIALGSNEISLLFSTSDVQTGFIFMSAFIANKNKHFNAPLGNRFKLVGVTKLAETEVTSNSVLIKMRSPLCLREHNAETNSDYYYSVASADFAEKSAEIISRQLITEGFSEKFANDFSIVPINAKKTVVKHYGCFIECSIGDFVINADKSVINYLLKGGIGSRKSFGFGYAELLTDGE